MTEVGQTAKEIVMGSQRDLGMGQQAEGTLLYAPVQGDGALLIQR